MLFNQAAKAFVPVHGWSAQRTKLKFHRENTEKSSLKSNYVESYIVYACPQFVSDKKAVLHYNTYAHHAGLSPARAQTTQALLQTGACMLYC